MGICLLGAGRCYWDTEMMTKIATRLANANKLAMFSRFRTDERGGMTIFSIMIFWVMLLFGGIAVDLMRFETRRVALQNTMDRAALAAADLTQPRPAEEVFNDWFAKTGLDDSIERVEYRDLEIDDPEPTDTLRRLTASARVRSYNFFMPMFRRHVNYLEGPVLTEAQQGAEKTEVMLVLDVSWSMNESAQMNDVPSTVANESTYKKIDALKAAAKDFVKVVKDADTRNMVSIGIVPYNGQVKVPTNLRNMFNVRHLAMDNGVATGVTNANCMELPVSSYDATGLSEYLREEPVLPSDPWLTMAAVADVATDPGTTGNLINLPAPPSDNSQRTNRICNSNTNNHVLLPTMNVANINATIDGLTQGGYTSIAIGMRWGTALLDQSAAPIYAAIGDASVQGRPAANNDPSTKKIIILMTDGTHYETQHVKDTYKSGPSPIYRGADGKIAIRFTSGGPAFTGGTRPSCAGANTYFVPHLKSGTSCVANSWKANLGTAASPMWTGSGTVRQLDWSEVWRYMGAKYLARQVYARSGVTGTGPTATDYNTVFNGMVGLYLEDTYMDELLKDNCAAAKNVARMDIYSIALAAPDIGKEVLFACASDPKGTFYYEVTGSELQGVFNEIAKQLGELRLTQ
jgi:Mg-chelatase subunit ChlD